MSSIKSVLLRKPLISYFVLSYAITWVILLVGIFGQASPLIIILSTFGPLVAALTLTGAESGWSSIRDLLGRAKRWNVGLRWYVLVILGPALVYLTALILTALGSGFFLDLARLQYLPDGSPWYLAPVFFLVILFLGGPLGEEFGWRGYALPRPQRDRETLAASLILGVLWAGWHLPLFWLPYSGQFNNVHGTGIGNYIFFIVEFFVRVILLSVFFAWLYNGTNRSLLLPLLLHASLNMWDAWIHPLDPAANRMYLVMANLILLTVIILVFWLIRVRRLSRAREAELG